MIVSKMIVILLVGFAAVCTAVDLTLLSRATGSFVVQATLAKLDNAFPNENSFWDIRKSTFMRTLAFIESQDGAMEVQQAGIRQGIWRVDINALNAIEREIQIPERQNVMEAINELGPSFPTWSSIFDIDNMETPLHSCMAARVYLLFYGHLSRTSSTDCIRRANDIIPLGESGEYWHECYHQSDASLSPTTFYMQYQDLLTKADSGIECKVDTDLSFVLDSSGSIGPVNWELVRDYVDGVVSSGIANEGDRVAIIRYSTEVVVDISLDSDQSELSSVIAVMGLLGRLTNTSGGLLELLNQPWRQNVLQIAIVMTDGRSTNVTATLNAIERVRIQLPALTIFVVGVAKFVQSEVVAIATSNNTISSLITFNAEDLTNTLQRQAHQICFSVSSEVNVGDYDSTKYEEFLQSREIRLTYEVPEENGFTIRLCVEKGHARLYGSFFIPNPNPAFHDFVLDAITHGQMCEDIFILPMNANPGRKRRQVSESTRQLVFVAIEGVANSSTFSLESDFGNTAQYLVSCSQNPCGNNAVCTNVSAGGYSCNCLPGFIFGPDATNCQDINECELLHSPCNPFATCSNTIGSVECTCLSGYSGNGFKCIIEQNTELRLIVSVVCGVGGGALFLVVVVAAIISIYAVLSANKLSRFHRKDDTSRPADPNLSYLGDSQTNLFSIDVLY